MVELPPAIPFTSHVTAVLVELVVVVFAKLTVAVKSVCPPGATLAELGVIETELTVTALFEHPKRIPATMIKSAQNKIGLIPFFSNPCVTPDFKTTNILFLRFVIPVVTPDRLGILALSP